MFNLKILGSGFGESFAKTLAGPPDSTIPAGLAFLMSESLELYGSTDEKTFASLFSER